ncbi:MAG: M12 family metallopeptidase [Kofleriaceae bacterium]
MPSPLLALRRRIIPLIPLLLSWSACALDAPELELASPDLDPTNEALPREGEVGQLRAITPDGPMTLTYVVQGGHAIHEEDVDLGPVAELRKYRGGAAHLGARWPEGKVYFRFDHGFTGVVCHNGMTNCVDVRTRVRNVLDAMEAKLPLRFIWDYNDSADNYITFEWAPSDSVFAGRSDSIGMDGGEQLIRFRSGHEKDSLNPHWYEPYNLEPSTGTIRHEVLHAVGLSHEQSRPDRDLFIEVHEECILSDQLPQFAPKAEARMVGPYDFTSIMHYPATKFCAPVPFGLPDPDGDGCLCVPMIPKIAGAVIGAGPRPGGFSVEDTNTVYRMYANASGANSTSDHYGAALAIGDFDGDGYDDLAVGVPDEEGLIGRYPNFTVVENAGAVLLYKGTSAGPVAWRTLTEADFGGLPSEQGRFGASLVALDLDADGLEDLAVGAPGRNNEVGAVFTYRGSQTQKMVADHMLTQGAAGFSDEAGDRFGAALAAGPITGMTRTDACNSAFNGNFYDALVIGAPGDTNVGVLGPGNRGGAAYIFQSVVASCSTEAVAKATRISNAAATGDNFGAAVAVGLLNGDQRADVVVGAPGYSTSAGAVYTYQGRMPPETSPLLWSAMATYNTRVTGDRLSRFGAALAIGNLLSAPGRELVVGAPGLNGKVVVMTGGLSPVSAQVLVDEAPEFGDQFGAALAIGNIQAGDTGQDLVVGIPGEDLGAGAIAIFHGAALSMRETLRQRDLAPGYDSDVGDQFGAALALGQLDGNGPVSSTAVPGLPYIDLAIGAPGEAPDNLPYPDEPAGAGMVNLLRGAAAAPVNWRELLQPSSGKL